jgi:CheY-like chemotaxis protein
MAQARAVLVVDDDTDVLDIMVEAIQGMGRTVYSAADGSAALNQLAHVPRPCLIFLDLYMRPMSGVEFLEALGTRGDREDFLVVATSGDPAGLRGIPGVVSVLQKPFSEDALGKVLDTLVARSE